MKKIDLERKYELLGVQYSNLQNELFNLKKELIISQDSKKIKILNKELEKYKQKWDYYNLGLNFKDFVFLRYKRLNAEKETYTLMGYIKKESINHLKLHIHDNKRNTLLCYYINKDNIIDIKVYDNKPDNYITYEELNTLKSKGVRFNNEV